MKKNHNNFLPYCRVWISLSHRSFDIFLWVNICWYRLVSISQYPGSMSWWSLNRSKMALFPEIMGIATSFPSRILYYGHPCLIEPLIFISRWILVKLNNLHFYLSDSVSWWSQNSRKIDLAQEILGITTFLYCF